MVSIPDFFLGFFLGLVFLLFARHKHAQLYKASREEVQRLSILLDRFRAMGTEDGYVQAVAEQERTATDYKRAILGGLTR